MIKKISVLMALCMMFSVPLFAADPIVNEVVQPDWIAGVLTWLQTLPKVGPYLVIFCQYVGLIGGILTVLSVAVQAVLTLPEIAARFSGAPALADKIKYWSDKVVYWLKYFSMRNAQK